MKIENVTVCVFDAYGTLFDVNSAAAKCKEKLGDKWEGFANAWRTTQLEYTWLRSLMKKYKNFFIKLLNHVYSSWVVLQALAKLSHLSPSFSLHLAAAEFTSNKVPYASNTQAVTFSIFIMNFLYFEILCFFKSSFISSKIAGSSIVAGIL